MEVAKKSLDEITMCYVCVTQIALGANLALAVKAIAEARPVPDLSATPPANSTASKAA